MTNNRMRQQIICLHYIYPLPLQKLRVLLKLMDDFQHLSSFPPMQLAHLLNIKVEKASKIQSDFVKFMSIPFEDIYQEKQIYPILFNDPHYPKELFQLIDPPSMLYTMGDVSLLSQTKIAVIGSRHATNYSKKAMEYIIPPLLANNYIIVSGLARGADTMAHDLTISLGGKTVGVLGNGFGHIYPKENHQLYHQMAKDHCLITEFPPYMGPKKWHFPLRNRIISGLSKALVVTEAAERSGTLITTEHALEHGKDVFVVPGPIDSSQSIGTNKLIKEGAIPVWNGHQIVNEIQFF